MILAADKPRLPYKPPQPGIRLPPDVDRQQRWPPRLDPRELGQPVTICIAAIAIGDQILTVSDRMLSSQYDIVQARDDAALKTAAIASKWAVMFSGNGSLFKPFVRSVRKSLKDGNEKHDLSTVMAACRDVYWRMSEEHIVSRFLYRFGFRDLREFRQEGFSQLGEAVFERITKQIESFSLGIDFLIYGYDANETPHIFSVEDPGEIIDHDIERFAVIGSGAYMARAALHRKFLFPGLPHLLYRLLDAKFSAETAAGVGRGTTVLAMRPDGKPTVLWQSEINAVRSAWETFMKMPEPEDVIEIIERSDLFKKMTVIES